MAVTRIVASGIHTCPPRWLVFIGGDAISSSGMYGENPTPSDEERDWHTVRAVDEEDAALNAAQDSNESREYYMMNDRLSTGRTGAER